MTQRAPRRMDRAARRKQLLECALRVYADRGIAGATHTEVAERAGVSIPTVFAYFPGKEKLTEAVLVAVEEVLWAIVERVKASKDDALTAFFEAYRGYAEAVRSHPDHIRIWFVWGTAIHDAYWPRYLSLLDRILAVYADVLRRGQRQGDIGSGVDVRDAARMLVANGHMVALMIFAGTEPERMRRYIGHLVKSALNMEMSDPGGMGADLAEV